MYVLQLVLLPSAIFFITCYVKKYSFSLSGRDEQCFVECLNWHYI